jgi:hypothetical protein
LAAGIGESSAQRIIAGYTVSGGSTIIVIKGDGFDKLITKHDRLFISLGVRRDFFRQTNPLNQADSYSPVVFEAQRFNVEEVELDRAIERLGRLIREKEQQGR